MVVYIESVLIAEDLKRRRMSSINGVTATAGLLVPVPWFVLGKAEASSAAASQARHRIACLQGKVDRPWTWAAF
jgi:hypothetical protein